MKGKIEFIEGESYLRYNGILMDEEGCKKVYGYPEGIPFICDRTIVEDGVLYTDYGIGEIIGFIGNYIEEIETYDPVIENGVVSYDRYLREHYGGHYAVSKYWLSTFDEIKEIKPYDEFVKKHPEIDFEAYFTFEEDMDQFYKNL